uniref:Uncharacterized protein n=1 Tax=Pipistrellus kuhlii TaxID=59472 RepID=A0A7J7QSU2_PIPKU|nr:hypothetical protein mPipKuh1_008600 [Pipistrellus kuhlii]
MERDPGEDPAPRARRGGRRRRRRRRPDSRARTVRSALQPPPVGAHGAEGARGPRWRWRWGWRRWGPRWWRPRGRGGPADNRLQAGACAALALLPGALCGPLRRVANAHFALVALLSLVPAVSAFPPGPALAPVLFLGAAAAARGLCAALRRHRAARAADRRRCQVFSGEQKRFLSRCWKDLHVGDFVRLGRDEMVPADILLLASSAPGGQCHVDTASLDGETSLKRRQAVRGFSEPASAFDPLTFTGVVECERPNNDLSRFRGCVTHSDGRKAGLHRENLLLRGCTVRNTEAVVGIVVYAGHETKALLNRSGPRYKRSKLERQMDRDVLRCVLLLVGLCLVSAVGHGAWVRRHQEEALFWVPEADGSSRSPATAAAYSFLTTVVLLQVLVPVSLYVSLEVVRLCQAQLLQQDAGLNDAGADARPRCRALHLAEDLGQVRHVFSDKTGTLTENRLAFRRCSVAGCEYAHGAHGERGPRARPHTHVHARTRICTHVPARRAR